MIAPRSSTSLAIVFGAALVAALAAGCATTPAAPSVAVTAGPPRFRRVHFDHVAPARVAQFEGARRDWLRALSDQKLDEGPTAILELPGPLYLTLHPFATWSELDAQKAAAARLDDAIGHAAVERYDAATHPCLVPPHHNEIWSRQQDLSFDSPSVSEASAGVARIETVEVAPREGDAYEAALAAVGKILVAARYPLARLVFVSGYGTGRYLILWLAPDGAALAAAPSVAEVLAQRVGPAETDKLLARLAETAGAHDEQPAKFRKDLVGR